MSQSDIFSEKIAPKTRQEEEEKVPASKEKVMPELEKIEDMLKYSCNMTQSEKTKFDKK